MKTFYLFIFLFLLSSCSIENSKKIINEPLKEKVIVIEEQIINESQVCEVDNDCSLPHDYAIRSSCPYEAVCQNSKCEVICPQIFRNDSFNSSFKEGVVEEAVEIKVEKKENWYKPKIGDTWQWQLSGNLNLKYDVDMYDIDLFDTPQKEIDELQERGIKVVCYISAGSYEDWREDEADFEESILGKNYEGWPGEKWIDIREDSVREIMKKRLDLAVEKNCDGIEPDNIHSYQENTGFDLTYEDQIDFNIWLANEAHKRNLSIALKNDAEQAKDLVDYYDFVIVEECFEWDECEPYEVFIENDKAVFGVEYNLKKSQFCAKAKAMKYSWLKMEYELDGGRDSC